MSEGFDKDYWETHWQNASGRRDELAIDANPYLAHETRDLERGTALDAGCGEGTEAIWLAAEGWQVTAVDISSEALTRASEHASSDVAVAERIEWVEADLSTWEPDGEFALVATHYAHPAIPQLDFDERISHWVAPVARCSSSDTYIVLVPPAMTMSHPRRRQPLPRASRRCSTPPPGMSSLPPSTAAPSVTPPVVASNCTMQSCAHSTNLTCER